MAVDDADANDGAEVASGYPFVTILAVVALGWYCVLWALSILGCVTGRKRYRLRPRSPLSSAPAESAPGVSILRPLKGLDANLFENLESTFTQEYPKARFEILLCVADEHDQALDVVRRLLEKYPDVDAKIVISEEIVGVNPKVNNLMRAYKTARHDILWVIDSNVQVDPGTLARSVDSLMQPPKGTKGRRTGVVHHVPFAFLSEPMLGARVEAAFLNTNHAKMYLALNATEMESCVMGKSCLYRRSDLERVTGDLKPISDSSANDGRPRGLAAFGRFLAEDNMIAAALMHELGLRHSLSCDISRTIIGRMSFSDYVARRMRWIRVRKRIVMAATISEPFTECIALSILGSWALYRLWRIPTFITFILHYCAWIYVDMDVYESLAGYYLPEGQRWSFFTAWLIREGAAFPIWLFAVFGDDVEWRGRKYRMLRNGEVTKASSASSWNWFSDLFGSGRRKNGYERVDQEAASNE